MNRSDRYATASGKEIVEILRAAFPKLRQKYPILSIAVFGSVLREDYDPVHSDIDLLVDYTSPDILLFLDLAEELEILLRKKVDIITRRSLKERQWDYLKDRILYV